LGVIELEAERFDEMQRRFRGRAQPRHVASVRRNFRFDQDDVHVSHSVSAAANRRHLKTIEPQGIVLLLVLEKRKKSRTRTRTRTRTKKQQEYNGLLLTTDQGLPTIIA
jgi:hypothetical protein